MTPCSLHTKEIRRDPSHKQPEEAQRYQRPRSNPRVDEVVDKLGSGRILSLFDLVSSLQVMVDKDTIPLTASRMPARLLEWLVIAQGTSAAPRWRVKVIDEVVKGLANIIAYLDYVIDFAPDPADHVLNLKWFFKWLPKHNQPHALAGEHRRHRRRFSPPHHFSRWYPIDRQQCCRPVTNMLMSEDLKQLRSLLGGLSYSREFLANVAKRIGPITLSLTQGVHFFLAPVMETITPDLLAEVSKPQFLAYAGTS